MKTTHLQKLCHQMFASYLAVRWLATLIRSHKLAELNSVWLVWFLASELKGCCFTHMSQTKHFHQTYAQLRRGLGVWPSHVRSGFISSCLWQEAAVMCRSLFLPLHVHAVLCDSPSPFTCGPLHLPLMQRSAPMWPADVHLMGHLLLMLY